LKEFRLKDQAFIFYDIGRCCRVNFNGSAIIKDDFEVRNGGAAVAERQSDEKINGNEKIPNFLTGGATRQKYRLIVLLDCINSTFFFRLASRYVELDNYLSN
jgi:hypothetical protein